MYLLDSSLICWLILVRSRVWLRLRLGEEAPLMFVDEDPTQGPVCVPDVEVVLVPTAGLAFAQHLHFKHNILSLIKIGM